MLNTGWFDDTRIYRIFDEEVLLLATSYDIMYSLLVVRLLVVVVVFVVIYLLQDDGRWGGWRYGDTVWWYSELQRRTKKNWPMYIHSRLWWCIPVLHCTVEPKFCVKLNNITVQISTAYFVEVCPQCCSLIFIHLATYYFRGCRVPEFLEKLHFGRYSRLLHSAQQEVYVCM